MKIWDVSMTIEPSMYVWKGRDSKRPEFTITRDYVDGEGARETHVGMDMHTGTHIDAPLHFIFEGQTMGSIPLEKLLRPVKVFDLTAVDEVITQQDLEKLDINQGDFVLFKTRNSLEDIIESNFIYISSSAAEKLVDLGVEGVGIDALGVERDQPDHGTHNALLGAGVIIIEGLRLKEVDQGQYFMIAAPLKVDSLEAAPARVLLTELIK